MQDAKKRFGDKLRKRLREKGLKIAQAAELFDVSVSYLNQLLAGTSGPSIETIYNIEDKVGPLGADNDSVIVSMQEFDRLNKEAIAWFRVSMMSDLIEKIMAMPSQAAVLISGKKAAFDQSPSRRPD